MSNSGAITLAHTDEFRVILSSFSSIAKDVLEPLRDRYLLFVSQNLGVTSGREERQWVYNWFAGATRFFSLTSNTISLSSTEPDPSKRYFARFEIDQINQVVAETCQLLRAGRPVTTPLKGLVS